MNKETLEMWKIERIISWLDCVFDTCFIAFLWIMGWKVIFWIYVGIALVSLIGHVVKIINLENKK